MFAIGAKNHADGCYAKNAWHIFWTPKLERYILIAMGL